MELAGATATFANVNAALKKNAMCFMNTKGTVKNVFTWKVFKFQIFLCMANALNESVWLVWISHMRLLLH